MSIEKRPHYTFMYMIVYANAGKLAAAVAATWPQKLLCFFFDSCLEF